YFQLREVTTSLPVLQAGGQGLTDVYNDLGDGTIFGGGLVSTNQQGSMVSIPLNADFVAALVATQGGSLALGGQLTSLDDTPGNDEYLFGQLPQTGALPGIYVRLHVVYALTSVPFFISEPPSIDASIGSSHILAVGACGTPPFTYQWTFNGTNLPGATSSSISLTNIGLAQAGDYRVVVGSAALSATSTVARLTVAPVVIRTQLVSQVALLSNRLDLEIDAHGLPPLSYEWRKDGVPLAGSGNDGTFALSSVNFDDAGDYEVLISNSFGTVTSAVAHVSVEARAPFFVLQPSNAVFTLSHPFASFHAIAQAGPPPRYQWYFQGSPLSGQTGQYL